MANDTINPVTQYYLNSMYPGGSTSNTSSATGSSFTQLLSGLMGSSSASLLGDFSSVGGTDSSYMSGLMGSSLLGGMGGTSSSDSSMMTMLLMLLLLQKTSNNNSTVLNTLTNTNTQAQNTACQHVYQYPSSYFEQQGIPANACLPANPPITNSAGERNQTLYRAVINQFDVENNARYQNNKKGEGDTYCNIFAWDVTRAMGAEIPHYIDAQTGAPAIAGASNAKEMDANQVNDWLNTYGTSYGWVKASAEQAQQYADAGMPAVTSWKNPSGHGHLQVVSPSTDGQYDASRGVAIAQAGAQRINYGYASSVYGAEMLQQVEYFVHI